MRGIILHCLAEDRSSAILADEALTAQGRVDTVHLPQAIDICGGGLLAGRTRLRACKFSHQPEILLLHVPLCSLGTCPVSFGDTCQDGRLNARKIDSVGYVAVGCLQDAQGCAPTRSHTDKIFTVARATCAHWNLSRELW